jgi:hypothetical protein
MSIDSEMTSCCHALCSTEEADARVRREIESAVLHFAEHPEGLQARLDALDGEWDLRRTVQAHAGAVVLGSLMLGMFSRKWRMLAFMAGGFLLYSAFGGWCPAETLWRRMGVRKAEEIALERCALKALRGDFESVTASDPPRERALRALKAVGLA